MYCVRHTVQTSLIANPNRLFNVSLELMRNRIEILDSWREGIEGMEPFRPDEESKGEEADEEPAKKKRRLNEDWDEMGFF